MSELQQALLLPACVCLAWTLYFLARYPRELRDCLCLRYIGRSTYDNVGTVGILLYCAFTAAAWLYIIFF